MMFGVKTALSCKLAFLPAQSLATELLQSSAAAANHEPMTPFSPFQRTLHKSALRQDPVGQIQTAQQAKHPIDGNIVWTLAVSSQGPLDVVWREWHLRFLQSLQHSSSGFGDPVPLSLQEANGVLYHGIHDSAGRSQMQHYCN